MNTKQRNSWSSRHAETKKREDSWSLAATSIGGESYAKWRVTVLEMAIYHTA